MEPLISLFFFEKRKSFNGFSCKFIIFTKDCGFVVLIKFKNKKQEVEMTRLDAFAKTIKDMVAVKPRVDPVFAEILHSILNFNCENGVPKNRIIFDKKLSDGRVLMGVRSTSDPKDAVWSNEEITNCARKMFDNGTPFITAVEIGLTGQVSVEWMLLKVLTTPGR